jgi:hypothetical protein
VSKYLKPLVYFGGFLLLISSICLITTIIYGAVAEGYSWDYPIVIKLMVSWNMGISWGLWLVFLVLYFIWVLPCIGEGE